MTPREQRKTRKKWKKYSSDYRKNQRIEKDCKDYIAQNTPPSTDEFLEENRAPELLNNDINNQNMNAAVKRVEAKRRSLHQRKLKNIMLQKKNTIIAELKRKLNIPTRKNIKDYNKG